MNSFKYFLEKYFYLILLCFIQLIILVFQIIPFLRYNNLFVWDMAGHYFSAWFTKEYLFPHVFGWNHMFYAGYPQNQFYPPLHSYLTAALSYIFGLEWAFKLTIVITLVLIPFSFYYFARSFKWDKLKSSIITLIMFSILYILEQGIGGSYKGIFNVGLVTNIMALHIFFFYVSILNTSLEKKENKEYILISVLFSLIILTHIFTALAAFFVFFSFFVYVLWLKREKAMFMCKHLILTGLLTSFWTIPFIFKLKYLTSITIGAYFPLLLFIISVLFLILILLVCFYYEQKYIPIIIFLLCLLFFIVGGRLLGISIHYYRFFLFFYLFIPIMLVFILEILDKHIHRVDWNIILLVVVLICFISLKISIPQTIPKGVKDVDMSEFSNLNNLADGRTLSLVEIGEQSSVHLSEHQYVMMTKNKGTIGLFVESSPNGRYLQDIRIAFNGSYIQWGTYTYNPNITKDILKNQLRLYNVNYLLSAKPLENFNDSYTEYEQLTLVKEADVKYKGLNYSLYQIDNSSMIEVLNYTPQELSLEENDKKLYWDYESIKWFLSYDNLRVKVFNHNHEKLPKLKGNGEEKITYIKKTKNEDYIRFFVDSEEKVPILIKMTYFLNWKAYVYDNAGNKKEIEVFKATPYLMLIYAKGEIDIVYKMILIDYVGIILSLIGLIWFITLVISNFNNSQLKV